MGVGGAAAWRTTCAKVGDPGWTARRPPRVNARVCRVRRGITTLPSYTPIARMHFRDVAQLITQLDELTRWYMYCTATRQCYYQ